MRLPYPVDAAPALTPKCLPVQGSPCGTWHAGHALHAQALGTRLRRRGPPARPCPHGLRVQAPERPESRDRQAIDHGHGARSPRVRAGHHRDAQGGAVPGGARVRRLHDQPELRGVRSGARCVGRREEGVAAQQGAGGSDPDRPGSLRAGGQGQGLRRGADRAPDGRRGPHSLLAPTHRQPPGLDHAARLPGARLHRLHDTPRLRRDRLGRPPWRVEPEVAHRPGPRLSLSAAARRARLPADRVQDGSADATRPEGPVLGRQPCQNLRLPKRPNRREISKPDATGARRPVMQNRLVAVPILSVILVAACATSTTQRGAPPTAGAAVDPAAGAWRTWVLGSGKDLRLPPPPDAQLTATELQQVQSLARQRDAAALERVRRWDFWSPTHQWNDVLTDVSAANPMPGGSGIRAFAMMNVALHDALVAAWDSKYAHNRPRPGQLDSSLVTAVAVPASPSYPCEH